MKYIKRIVIVGGTSAIAEHCARIWAQAGPVHLTLVVRNLTRANQIAADLRVRSPQSLIDLVQTGFTDPDSIQAVVDATVEAGSVDIVLIAHGSLPDQKSCERDLRLCNDALTINALSPVMFAEAFAGHMAKAGHGTLALIGSVAGDRGRKSNYVYGSAKGLVTRYAQGLQHRFAGTGVRVVLIKPGPTDTPMTAHMKEAGTRMAPVSDVADRIVRAIEKGQPVAYAPRKWQLIMLVIRHLPTIIFNKLNI